MKVRCGLSLLLFIFLLGSGCSSPFSSYKINARDKEGNSPLHHAAGKGEIEVAKRLVSQGADINAKNNVGETPLHLASYNDHLELVKYLVSHGSDIDAKDKYGSTPFQDALNISKLKIAEYLATQGADVNCQDTDGTSPLHYAASSGNLMVVKFLLSHGAHINFQDNFGNSPLHQASRLGDRDVVKYLVSRGADIDMIDKFGNSPLLEAAGSGSLDVIKFLVSQGADINHKNNNEETALDLATRRGYTNIAIYLYAETNRLNRPSFPQKTEASIKTPLKKIPEDIYFGDYHALVIGNNDYKFMPKLKTAVNDANAVARLLQESYDYDVKMIENGTRREILSALDKFRNEFGEDDNLLIYYAGHGYFDKDANRGYWLPIDANYGTSADWISNADITDKLKALKAKHVIVVADSCYSGTLTRGLKVTDRTSDYLQRISRIRSRTVLTSGGFEPVADSGGGNHSVFANAFLEILRKNTGIIDGTQLFSEIRRPVMVNAPQTPQYSDIRFAGHEGGDFLFIRIK